MSASHHIVRSGRPLGRRLCPRRHLVRSGRCGSGSRRSRPPPPSAQIAVPEGRRGFRPSPAGPGHLGHDIPIAPCLRAKPPPDIRLLDDARA